MQTSAKGIADLEAEEGVVLRAYRDVVGVWTIGAGLTAASGVVKPKAGMQITRAEATNLLQRALRERYEPNVADAMPAAKQHEFDAGVSFHFNTGAIRRASWVTLWRKRAGRDAIKAKLLLWTKGGGKVLPGLVKRREREAAMLLDGVYSVSVKHEALTPTANARAAWALSLTLEERKAAAAALKSMGYDIGLTLATPYASVIRQFQRDHGLTVDGIIGRATLSTLQRRIDAKARAVPAVGVPAVAASGTATGAWDAVSGMAVPDSLVIAGAAAFGLWTAYRYRDVIAAKVQNRASGLARFLRSF
jgi:lysozyme